MSLLNSQNPKQTLQHLRQVVDADKAMIIATTGFNSDELATVKGTCISNSLRDGTKHEPRCQCDDSST